MISPSLTSWRAQFERLERGYARLLEPYQSSVIYNDDLAHFFQDCWHLKDWIKNDPSAGISNRIEKEVENDDALQVVRKLANASKHLALRGERAYVTSTNVTVHLGQNKGIEVDYVVTLDDGSTRSAQDLVHEAFAAWQAVLKRIGLTT